MFDMCKQHLNLFLSSCKEIIASLLRIYCSSEGESYNTINSHSMLQIKWLDSVCNVRFTMFGPDIDMDISSSVDSNIASVQAAALGN